MIEIKNRWNSTTIYKSEAATTVAEAVLEAVQAGASLNDADLYGLVMPDGASLDRARLDGASLDRASLVGARLVGARLDRASLVGARLVGARLDGASLDRASLDRASLDAIRDDFWAVLDAAPQEVRGMLATLRLGKVDGSTYSGACACLVGTIANLRGCDRFGLGALKPDSNRPAEVWFLAIRPGHTPENHEVARITERWTLQWLEKNQPEAAETVAADAEAAKILQHFVKRRHEMFGAGDVEGLKALRGELERRANA